MVRVIWTLGYKNGHDDTNKNLIERYKNGGTVRTMTDIFFKKKMSFDDWMKYIEHGYSTKKGWKKKNVLKYLRENGFID